MKNWQKLKLFLPHFFINNFRIFFSPFCICHSPLFFHLTKLLTALVSMMSLMKRRWSFKFFRTTPVVQRHSFSTAHVIHYNPHVFDNVFYTWSCYVNIQQKKSIFCHISSAVKISFAVISFLFIIYNYWHSLQDLIL